MHIAIDISPISNRENIQHRVRGVGSYIRELQKHLPEYFPDNLYTFFTRGEKLPEDVNILHIPYFEPFFLTLPFALADKTVVTVHDLTPFVFPKNFPTGIKGQLKWRMQRYLLKKTSAIIADSQSSKEDIIKYTGIPDKRIEVVYLAPSESFKQISDKKTLHAIKIKYNLPEKFVLYVGDVTWNKNLPRLVEAARKENIPFVMVGKALVEKEYDFSNPWNQDLLIVQKMIAESKSIIRLGFVATEDLVGIYNLASMFVMPSLYEGFGLPILEAMSCGCPVVTTKEGSLKEVAGEAAYFVNAYDTEDIAEGVKKVFLSQDLQAELSKKGLQQAKKFTWKNTVRRTVDVYKMIFENDK